DLALGANSSCVRDNQGGVLCWGDSSSGQLGNGSTNFQNNPTPGRVLAPMGMSGNLSDVVAISAGDYHACVVRSDMTAWCWGSNLSGELGSGSTTPQDYAFPSQVRDPNNTSFLTQVVSVAAGQNHSCAARSDGTVWCWGDNSKGELGNS